MILQPEALEVIIRWAILLGNPLSSGSIDAPVSIGPYIRTLSEPLYSIDLTRLLTALARGLAEMEFGVGRMSMGIGIASSAGYPLTESGTDLSLQSQFQLQHSSVVPLQSGGADIDKLVNDLKDALKLPSWVGPLLKYSGLITLMIGLIAYFISPSVNNRRKGFAMAVTGFLVAIVGIAFPVFINLIEYVLSG